MNTGQTILGYSLDDYFKTTMVGSVRQSITNNLYGVNHRQIPNMVPMNKDRYGYTFFVRPQLNLSDANIANQRLFFPLLARNPNSLHSFVRSTLDPRGVGSNVVDPNFAFIPVLSNNLKSISGWDDLILPTHTTSEGLYGESYSFADGYLVNYKTYDIDATFTNSRGDPIMYMFYIWLLYMSAVFEGTLVPYADFIMENELDYNTRIYRLVMDQTNTYVRKIVATGAAFPITLPTGGFFDFSSDKPFNDQVMDISVRFRCMGMIYQDNILVDNFNSTVNIFNSDMKSQSMNGNGDVVKIESYLLPLFNNRGYPRINPANSELEWWISKPVYEDRVNNLIKGNNISENFKLINSVAELKNQQFNKGPIHTDNVGGYIQNLESINDALSAEKPTTNPPPHTFV